MTLHLDNNLWYVHHDGTYGPFETIDDARACMDYLEMRQQ